MKERKTLLSTLWIFVSMNYIFCDVITQMEPAVARGLVAGYIGGIEVTQVFLLSAGILLEIPFLMIVLSRFLPYGANRAVNIIAAILLVIVQAGSFFVGSEATMQYVFFSVVEASVCMLVVFLAMTWRNPENATEHARGVAGDLTGGSNEQ